MRHSYANELMQAINPLVKKWLVLESTLSRHNQISTLVSSYHDGNGSDNIDSDDRIMENLSNDLLSGIADLVHGVHMLLNSPLIESSQYLTQDVLIRSSSVLNSREPLTQGQVNDIHIQLDSMIRLNDNILDSQNSIDRLNQELDEGLAFPLVDIELLRVALIDILGTAEHYTYVVNTFPRPNQNDTLPELADVQAGCGALHVCLMPTPNSASANRVIRFLGNTPPRYQLSDNQEDEMAYAAVALTMLPVTRTATAPAQLVTNGTTSAPSANEDDSDSLSNFLGEPEPLVSATTMSFTGGSCSF